jgi:hypothetical protein
MFKDIEFSVRVRFCPVTEGVAPAVVVTDVSVSVRGEKKVVGVGVFHASTPHAPPDHPLMPTETSAMSLSV